MLFGLEGRELLQMKIFFLIVSLTIPGPFSIADGPGPEVSRRRNGSTEDLRLR
jgi:hypothetical protein